MEQLIDFIVALLRLTGAAVAVLFIMGVAFLIWVIVREAAWVVQQENRRKYEHKERKEEKNNADGSF
ncbi:MAG: hypothetical protein KBS60_05435 [Phascolarctobacterium sp.]|nr:hypothetical protein [Candidatus Phascolarctobacterium caballi]